LSQGAFAINLDECVQLGIQALDVREVGVDNFDR
jgi:hypothetical protein